MKKKIILTILLCLIAIPLCAGTITIGKKKSGGACTNPDSGTVIIGTASTDDTNHYATAYQAGVVWGSSNALTASWSGTCTTTTMASITVRGAGHAVGNVKWFLLNGSTRAIIATTNAVATNESGDPAGSTVFSFASAPTITKGTTYILAMSCDVDACYWPAWTTSAGNNIFYDGSGSYASPPDPVTLNDSGDDGLFSAWGVK